MPESEQKLPRLLIVDDDRTVVQLLLHWLEAEGYPCAACTSGDEAMDLMEREDFDILFLDWHMEGRDGLDVVRAIRARKGPTSPYVILATGEEDEDAIPLAFQAGADDFERKPLGRARTLIRLLSARRVIALEQGLRDRAGQDAVVGMHRGGIRELSEVVATLAHDLRTPLGTVRMDASTLRLRSGDAMPELLPVVDRIERVSARMAETLDDVVSAFVADDGTSEIWTDFDMSVEVVRSIEMLSSGVAEGTVLVPPQGTVRLVGNPFGLRRIVLNLVSNALRHSRARRVAVDLERDSEQGWMRLEVSDDGVGIPESLLRHLGEAMLLSSATRRQEFFVKGTGLGLTICRRIAAQHGGRIIVSSGPRSGTRARVWLRTDLAEPDKSVELAPIEVEVLP